MFTCKVCGTQAEDNINFCPKCGANLKQNGIYSDSKPSANEPAAPVAPVAPAAPAAPAPEKKEKKGNKGLIIAIAAILVVAIGVGAFFLFGGMKGAPATTGAGAGGDEVVITNEAIKEIEEEDLTTLALYPDREVSKSDLEEFATLIDERAKVLGDTYQVMVEDDRIILVIEKDILGKTAAEKTATVEMLISRGNICIGNEEYPYYEVDKKNIKSAGIEEIDRIDVLSDYRANMVDKRYEQLDKANADTLYAVLLKISGEAVENVEKVISYNDSNYKATFLHDFDPDDASSDTVSFLGSILIEDDDDASKLYLVSAGSTYEKNADLVLLLLEQKEMEFGLVMDILDAPNWEVKGKRMGENQLTEMSGEALIVKCTPDRFTRNYNSDVDFAEYESAVKSRLDNLDIEYMFGTTGFDDKTYCIKVRPEELSPEFVRLIFGAKSLAVRSAFDDVYGFNRPELIEKDGKLALRLTMYEEPAEIMSQYSIANNTLYFVANELTVASADITKAQQGEKGYYLDFEFFTCFDSPTATDEERAFLETVCALSDEGYASFAGTFSFVSDSDANKTDIDDFNWKYSGLTENDVAVFATVNSLGADVEKNVESRSTIEITLDEKVDEDLPKNFIKKMKEIYAACNFDDGAYSKITFVIKNEKKESPANEFRFVVTKDTYNGKMEINDRVGGPKFSDYWMEVYDITNEDSFFTERAW